MAEYSEGQSRFNINVSQVKMILLVCQLCNTGQFLGLFNPIGPGELCSQGYDQKDAEELLTLVSVITTFLVPPS